MASLPFPKMENRSEGRQQRKQRAQVGGCSNSHLVESAERGGKETESGYILETEPKRRKETPFMR